MDERFEKAPVGVFEVLPDGTVVGVNEQARTLLDLDAETAETVGPGGAHSIREVFPDSVKETVPRAIETAPDEQHHVEEYYPGLDRWLDATLVPTGETITVYLRDCSDRYRDRQTIGSLRGELDRLSNINALISDVLAELVGASTREEIAETICTRLGETDLYEFAWVGERELGGEEIVVRAAAGDTGRTLDAIEACLDETTTPEGRAVETGDSHLLTRLGEDESVPEPVRRAAFADGIQSLLAMPLTYGASVYGVVAVYAADQNAFSERERANFETVGEMAGFAINATRHRNLLLSDTVVELTLELSDRTDPLVAVTADYDCELTLEGLVPQREGHLLCYLSLTQEPEPVADSLDRAETVAFARVVGDFDGAGSLEIALEEETPLGTLAAQGVTIESGAFEAGRGRLVAELSPDEDVRRIADALAREFDVQVLAKRERERDVTTRREFRDELREELTARQENALRAAFFADYFESPRESTAEEVAGALDITGPTLLYHLRAGQRKLLAEFFETTAQTDRRE